MSCLPASPKPTQPVLTFTECQPDIICLDKNGAIELVLYLEALNRWMAELDATCSE